MGSAYVVHGRSARAPVDLVDVAAGRGGFAIEGPDFTGSVVAGGGDRDGDGVPDLLVGRNVYGDDLPIAFVVSGKADVTNVILGEVGSSAVAFPQDEEWALVQSAATVPDLTCDGGADVMFRGSYGFALVFE